MGSRQVRTHKPTCSDLDDPLILVIALSIDPETAFVQLPDQFFPSDTDPTHPATDLLLELKSEKRSVKSTEDPLTTQNKSATTSSNEPTQYEEIFDIRDWRYWFDIGIAMGAGFLPGISTGFLLQAYMDLPWIWPLQFNLLYWMKSETESKSGGKGVLQATQGSMSVCPLSFDFSLGKWIICGGGQVSVEEARSMGFQNANDQTFWQFSLELNSRLYLPITELLGVCLGADLMVPIPRHRYQIDLPEDDLTLYVTSPIAVRWEIALGVHF